MISILGQHISLIRPERFNKPKIYRNELPVIKYSKKPKLIKEHSGRVIAICIKVGGKVLSITKGIHADVCLEFNIDPLDVEKNGWELDNGNFVWR